MAIHALALIVLLSLSTMMFLWSAVSGCVEWQTL
jgi:hypothetical protein